MAISLHRMLRDHGQVVQDELADRLASAYAADQYRNYAPSMHGVLKAIGDGESWQSVTAAQFDGQWSWGNGAGDARGPARCLVRRRPPPGRRAGGPVRSGHARTLKPPPAPSP
jgi:hypothetical protein